MTDPHRKTAQARRDAAMSEAELLSQVIALARMHGWLVHHQRPARTANGWTSAIQGDTGWPDLVVSRGPALYVWELKRQGAKPRPDQEAWLASLRAAGVDAQVLHPGDWPYIAAVLTARPPVAESD